MRVLCTGGAGFLGSVLVPLLLEQGWHITVLDNFLYRQTSLLDVMHHKNLEVVCGDCRDAALVKRLADPADAILPLACLTGAPACARDPWAAEETIVGGMTNILSARRRLLPQLIVYPNTNSGYGSMSEGTTHCTEETPLLPISLYGRLKCQAEDMAMQAGNAVSLRFATLFGCSPRMRLDLLCNRLCFEAAVHRCAVLFEGHMRRNFLHVRDAARAFLHVLHGWERVEGEVYNVGLSDANLTKQELCAEIHKAVPDFVWLEAQVGRDVDRRDYLIDHSKFEATGFQPVHSLQDGICEVVAWSKTLGRMEHGNA